MGRWKTLANEWDEEGEQGSTKQMERKLGILDIELLRRYSGVLWTLKITCILVVDNESTNFIH